MIIKNTMIDDICSVIGFNATMHLVSWVGGENLYIPYKVNLNEKHLLSKLLGINIAIKLCDEWPSQVIQVPTLRSFDDLRKRKKIVRMFEMGYSTREIAANFQMTRRRAEQIRREFDDVGMIGVRKSSDEKYDYQQMILPGIDEQVSSA